MSPFIRVGSLCDSTIPSKPGHRAFLTSDSWCQRRRLSPGRRYWHGFRHNRLQRVRRFQHLVDNTVLLRLLSTHVVVAIAIALDLLEGLPGMLRQNFQAPRREGQGFPRRHLDVRDRPAEPARALMDQDASIGKNEAFAL